MLPGRGISADRYRPTSMRVPELNFLRVKTFMTMFDTNFTPGVSMGVFSMSSMGILLVSFLRSDRGVP